MVFEFSVSYMITYILTTVLAFSGVYVGALLALMAKEELKPGRAYLKAFENTLLVFIFLILLYSYDANIIVIILLGIVASVFLYLTTNKTPVNQIAYFLLGIALYFSTKSTDLFIMTATMIFLYGLPIGSIYVSRRLKKSKKTIFTDLILHFGLFVIVALMTNLIGMYMVKW